jgi:hypothetical protein
MLDLPRSGAAMMQVRYTSETVGAMNGGEGFDLRTPRFSL